MKYTKPALSFEDQAQRLINRGLSGIDKASLTNCLRSVNYYRLSAYWFPYKTIDKATGQEIFKPNTNFDTIWDRYTFDCELRMIIMDGIREIEISILRTQMVESFTLAKGPFCYCDIANYNPTITLNVYNDLITKIQDASHHSSETFVKSFKTKYSHETFLPLWMAVEIMTFGQLFTMFRYLDRTILDPISNNYHVSTKILVSWLKSLNYIRNVCAHHSRLWNREIPIKPFIPFKKNSPEFHNPELIDNRRVFAILSIISYLLLKNNSTNQWSNQVKKLLILHPNIPITVMGFPENWENFAFWS